MYHWEREKCEFHPKTENNWGEFWWIPLPIWPTFLPIWRSCGTRWFWIRCNGLLSSAFNFTNDELLYLDVQRNSRVTYFNGLEFTTWNSFARLSGDIMVGIMIGIQWRGRAKSRQPESCLLQWSVRFCLPSARILLLLGSDQISFHVCSVGLCFQLSQVISWFNIQGKSQHNTIYRTYAEEKEIFGIFVVFHKSENCVFFVTN